jgi:hypothetical protein
MASPQDLPTKLDAHIIGYLRRHDIERMTLGLEVLPQGFGALAIQFHNLRLCA